MKIIKTIVSYPINLVKFYLFRLRLLRDWINYKIGLNKEIRTVLKEVKLRQDQKALIDKEILQLKEYNENNIAFINNEKDVNKSLKINLLAKEVKLNWFQWLVNRVFKFDGYIAYINQADDFKIFKVVNFKGFYDILDRESYALNKKIATYNGKPLMLVKSPVPISLEVDGSKLIYDAPFFYNYVNKITKTNLTNWGNDGSFMDFIRKNIILIIIGIALILLFTTPQGKEILAGIMPKKVE